jgi:copper homeostasis protein CutC
MSLLDQATGLGLAIHKSLDRSGATHTLLDQATGLGSAMHLIVAGPVGK